MSDHFWVTSRGVRRAALVVLAGVLATSCGGDDDDADAPAATESSSPGPTDATTTTTPPTGSSAPSSTSDDGSSATTMAADDTEGSTAGECADDAPETLTVGVFSETNGLDPTVSAGSGVAGGSEMAAIYDTLMRWDPDTGEFTPHVAESLESNDDATVWRMVLRDGVRFGNGDPLTTADVVASVERHQDPDLGSFSRGLSLRIESMEIDDDRTMSFHLTEPWATFPYFLADSGGMVVNPRLADERGQDGFSRDPSGGGVGPFELESYTPGEEIVMRARADYWGGQVCVDTLRFVPIVGGQTTFEALQADELDVAVLRDARVVTAALDAGYDGYVGLENMGGVVIMNNHADAESPTTDVRIRKAVAAALDPVLIDERANGGTGLPTSAMVHETSRFAVDGLEGPAYDTEEAARLVDEVLAEGEWDGGILLTCAADPASVDRAVTIESMLEAVGFDVEVEQSANPVQRVLVDGNFELACWGLGVRDDTPYVKLEQNFRSGSPSNYLGYESEAFDAALDQMRIAGDIDAQRAALEAAQQAWNETVPAAVLEAVRVFVAQGDAAAGTEVSQNFIAYYGDVGRE